MITVRELMDRLKDRDPNMIVMVKGPCGVGAKHMDDEEVWGFHKMDDNYYHGLLPSDGDPDFYAVLID